MLKYILGTPTRKSCKLLIAKDDCSLTADYYLQVPYMSYHWNQIGLTIKYKTKQQKIKITKNKKQKIGTPTSKSCEPLIAEDDYELTADYCLQLPYMSHNWYRPIFGFSVYLTTEVVNPFKLSNWCISWRNFCTKNGWHILWSAHQKLSTAVEKKNLSVLVQKLTFLP